MPGVIKMRSELTQDELKSALDYDPETGVFVWKIKPAKNVPVGRKAGSREPSNGHVYIKLFGVDYTAQRLAWFYMTGVWPDRLTFKDKNRANLRFQNLIETNAVPTKYDHSTPEGRAAYLADHRERYHQSYKDGHLRRNFGIGLDDYNRMHADQNGCCAICGKPETGTRNGKPIRMAVDHHHESGAVRDLLCTACNKLIGLAGEDIAVLESAIAYLRRHHPEPAIEFVPSHADMGMALH